MKSDGEVTQAALENLVGDDGCGVRGSRSSRYGRSNRYSAVGECVRGSRADLEHGDGSQKSSEETSHSEDWD